MSLPVRTTVEDINAVCRYLASKPIGAKLSEARAVVDRKHLDGRKLSAMRFWKLVEDENDRMKLTDLGRRSIEDSGAFQSQVFREVIREIEPYKSIVERADFRKEKFISATEVARHWYENFKDLVPESERALNLQAICFFHFAQGADVGKLTIGRKGQPTRLDFNSEVVSKFFEDPAPSTDTQVPLPMNESAEVTDSVDSTYEADVTSEESRAIEGPPIIDNNRVFISYSHDTDIVEHLKALLTYRRLEPVESREEETTDKGISEVIRDKMKLCSAAVILVGAETLFDNERNKVEKLNDDALIKIGAAISLYGEKFVMLAEEHAELPPSLNGQNVYRYRANELDMPATLKLMEAFRKF